MLQWTNILSNGTLNTINKMPQYHIKYGVFDNTDLETTNNTIYTIWLFNANAMNIYVVHVSVVM